MPATKLARGLASGLLDALDACRGAFGRDAERRTAGLLERIAGARFRDAPELIRLHETVLFLRAYPQSARVARLADRILFAFAARLRGVDPAPFEEAEVSGMAGTSLSTNFSYSFARNLADRHGRDLAIDWDSYAHPERLGPTLARIAPLAAEDWTVEPHPDWRRWFTALRGTLPWLLDRVDPETYDLLEIPLVWNLGESAASRSRTRLPRRGIFYHKDALLKRRDVSIEAEFAGPRIATRRLTRGEAERVLNAIVDTSAVRYRELWGFSYPDLDRVDHADLGRGVDLYWFGVPAAWRLPLRAYHGGMFFKNGVPVGYVETLSLFERAEVGFNLYYTFRDGETAWLYARLLKFCRQSLGVTCFSIDPYQLGHDNAEAIESGAFWFYRKLGFAPAAPETVRIMEQEEQRLTARSGYRTPARTLRKLAATPLFWGDGRPWANFSLPALGRRVGRGVEGGAWPSILARVASEVNVREILKAKNSADEVRYLRLLQRAPRLRRGILRLGQAEA